MLTSFFPSGVILQDFGKFLEEVHTKKKSTGVNSTSENRRREVEIRSVCDIQVSLMHTLQHSLKNSLCFLFL